eukprot:615316-Rhodomonas_salina.2
MSRATAVGVAELWGKLRRWLELPTRLGRALRTKLTDSVQASLLARGAPYERALTWTTYNVQVEPANLFGLTAQDGRLASGSSGGGVLEEGGEPGADAPGGEGCH